MRVVFFTYILILAEFDREPAVQAERTRIPLCLFLFGKAIVPGASALSHLVQVHI